MAVMRLCCAGLLFVLFAGCSNDLSKQELMQNSLESLWQTYSDEHLDGHGSMAVYVLSADKSYLMAAGDDAATITEHSRFRAASTTKTFTAAAIMSLHQQGLLDIDDTLVDLIPNSTEPYLPDTAAYAIPFKDEITIRQLLQYRAGVFDVANDKIPSTVA